MNLDLLDIVLLNLIQHDATATVKAIAADVDMSPNACWRRIRSFEEQGIVTSRVTILDPVKLGVGTTVFVSVRAAEHSVEWTEAFHDVVRSIPEVVEFYRMSGDMTYFMKLRVADIAHYDNIYQLMTSKVKIAEISANFSLEEIKSVSQVPLTVAQKLARDFVK